MCLFDWHAIIKLNKYLVLRLLFFLFSLLPFEEISIDDYSILEYITMVLEEIFLTLLRYKIREIALSFPFFSRFVR